MSTPPKTDHPAATDHERRALDSDELALADKARNPTLGGLSDSELSDLISLLRSRRNRARDIANRQGREARAKTSPAGATAASGNSGTLSKHDYLNAALDRAMQDRASREKSDAGGESQRDLAQKAMKLKQQGDLGQNAMTEDGGSLHPEDPDADAGKGDMAKTARNIAPSGAFEDVGDLPSRERSRTRY